MYLSLMFVLFNNEILMFRGIFVFLKKINNTLCEQRICIFMALMMYNGAVLQWKQNLNLEL